MGFAHPHTSTLTLGNSGVHWQPTTRIPFVVTRRTKACRAASKEHSDRSITGAGQVTGVIFMRTSRWVHAALGYDLEGLHSDSVVCHAKRPSSLSPSWMHFLLCVDLGHSKRLVSSLKAVFCNLGRHELQNLLQSLNDELVCILHSHPTRTILVVRNRSFPEGNLTTLVVSFFGQMIGSDIDVLIAGRHCPKARRKSRTTVRVIPVAGSQTLSVFAGGQQHFRSLATFLVTQPRPSSLGTSKETISVERHVKASQGVV